MTGLFDQEDNPLAHHVLSLWHLVDHCEIQDAELNGPDPVGLFIFSYVPHRLFNPEKKQAHNFVAHISNHVRFGLESDPFLPRMALLSISSPLLAFCQEAVAPAWISPS